MSEIEVHPAAAVWPMLPDDELQALADSIADVGLLEPIVLTPDGLLLDGRNRAAACRLNGWNAETVVYDGDPVAYVLARNDTRRHMTKGQRAMAAWQSAATESLTIREVAERARAGEAMTSWAKVVHEHAPEHVADIIAGTVSLGSVYNAILEARRNAELRDRDADEIEARIAQLTADRDALISEVLGIPEPLPGPEPDLAVDVTMAEVMGEPEHVDHAGDLDQAQTELDFLRRLNALRRSLADLDPPRSTDPSWVAAIRSSVAGVVTAAHDIANTVNAVSTPANVRKIR